VIVYRGIDYSFQYSFGSLDSLSYFLSLSFPVLHKPSAFAQGCSFKKKAQQQAVGIKDFLKL